MKKIVIPAILAAVSLVALGFMVQPVERASAVHTTIGTTKSVQFANADIEACTGAGAPVQTPPCVAADTVGIIAAGTLWFGEVCVAPNAGTVAAQTRFDGAAFVTSTVNIATTCVATGGDGLWLTQTAAGATAVDITVVFQRVGA